MHFKHFSIEEREIIQTMRWEKKSLREIARVLRRSSSSVSREVRKNFPKGHRIYTPRLANERALSKRTRRGREEHLKNERIRSYVVTHLKRRWSPEQISGSITGDLNESISHEAIYQFIYDTVSGGSNLPKTGMEDLRPCLRRRRRIRQPRGTRKCQRIWRTKGASIEDRPKIVLLRKRVGDWEGDSVESVDRKPGVNTLVERKVGLVFITRLADKTSAATVDAMASRFKDVPERFKKTVTLDNGPENRDWQSIERKIGLRCYSAHSYCSWERPTNENTNGLIRDYFPKKTDFSMISDEELRFVENELNSRPRKRLGWKTPLEAWSDAIQC
ncbi:IS30 family transposase [Candidatus Parcubacteria bacterium]|nr:IS30 family transposase [Candidatus Parcubacteria bacterium]